MHLGTQELILILLIVIVLFGGKKVAGLGKALGMSLREFRAEVRKTMNLRRDNRKHHRRKHIGQKPHRRSPMNQPIRQRKKRKLHLTGRLPNIDTNLSLYHGKSLTAISFGRTGFSA